MQPHNHPGYLLVVEGPDGAGTSTITELLHNEYGGTLTHEPGSNALESGVRHMLNAASQRYRPEAMAVGFAADRLAHIDETVAPALENGELVICDRYVLSNFTYQMASGVPRERIATLNSDAIQPDLTIVLDVAAETGMNRIDDREEEDVYETLDFQREVTARYRELAEDWRKEGRPVHRVDATPDADTVFEHVKTVVEDELSL